MTLTIIAAMAENRVIGKDNDLIWRLPDDLKRFKSLTSGHHIIMGRKTFESMDKPLPNRTSVIITRDRHYKAPEGCIVVSSIEEAIKAAHSDQQPLIIGGGEIYKLALPYAHKMELTTVHSTFEGDTYFPEFNPDEWNAVDKSYHESDDRHQYPFTFITYIKNLE